MSDEERDCECQVCHDLPIQHHQQGQPALRPPNSVEHDLEEEDDAPPPRSGFANGNGFNRKRAHADDNGDVDGLRAENDRLRNELQLLERSYHQLEQLFGAKCGEVIRLQQQLASSQGQLPPMSSSDITTAFAPTGGLRPSRAGKRDRRSVSQDQSDQGAPARQTRRQEGSPTASDSGFPYFQPTIEALSKPGSYGQPPPPQIQPQTTTTTLTCLCCPLCQITVNGESVMQSHLAGEKHRKNYYRYINSLQQQGQSVPPASISKFAPSSTPAGAPLNGAGGR